MSIIKSKLKAVLSQQTISKMRRVRQAATTKLRLAKQLALIAGSTAIRYHWVLEYSEIIQGGGKSIAQGKPCDRSGRPIPWMTYSSIEYFSQLDLTRCRVFEYGSGNGSKYWASRCQKIVSVENDPEWYKFGSQDLAANQTLLLHLEPAAYVNAIGSDEYDLIIIDGAYRYDCAKRAIGNLSRRGLFVLDNSDWFPAICRLLLEQGLLQVDFAGPGPLDSYAWCTSLFFSRDFALPRRSNQISVLSGLVGIGEGNAPLI